MTDLSAHRHSPARNNLNILRSTCAPTSIRWAKRSGSRSQEKRHLPAIAWTEIHRAQKSNVLPIEQLKAAHVPSRLRSLLESMLAFEPASRPGTSELAARLQRCSPEARTARRTRVTLAAAALLILGVSAPFIFLSLRTQNSLSNLGAPEKSIAVLPFENLSGDQANAYFADGIQDEILTRLSKIADLKVISRTSTQHYKSAPENLPRDRQATWCRPHLGRKSAEERRRSACERAVDQSR